MAVSAVKSLISLPPLQQLDRLVKLPNGDVLRLLNVREVINQLPKDSTFWYQLAQRKFTHFSGNPPNDLQSFKSILLDTQVKVLRKYVYERTALSDNLDCRPSNIENEPEIKYELLKKNLAAFYKTLPLRNLLLMEAPESLIEEHQEAMSEAFQAYMQEHDGQLSIAQRDGRPFPLTLKESDVDFICDQISQFAHTAGSAVVIEIDGCGFNDEHCRKVAALAEQGFIRELLLPNNKVTDDGYRILNEQLDNPASQLINIDLDGNLLS